MITLTRKIIMACTGIFLSLFLLIHFLGNTQLFLEPELARSNFNAYSHFMTSNPLIKLISYLLYISVVFHIIYALIITIKNKMAGGKYKMDRRGRASKWYSRNMGILGTMLLLFLALHFQNFWYQYKFGDIGLDSNGHKDLYTLVTIVFKDLWIVIIYVIAMIALSYHLIHGITSSIRTLGLFHPKYVRWVHMFTLIYAIVLSIGFLMMPLYIYFTN